MNKKHPDIQHRVIRITGPAKLLAIVALTGMGLVCAWITAFDGRAPDTPRRPSPKNQAHGKNTMWAAPALQSIPAGDSGNLIRYGRELIVHTSEYLGPKGSVAPYTNGMNCQNCHLDAGTKPFGNNYSAVASTYPKFRARSGEIETIGKRVNDCFERSLNGRPLPAGSREMKAIVRYIQWLGKDVTKGEHPRGSGLITPVYLDHPADPAKGKALYRTKCSACHRVNGQGVPDARGTGWTYPPLWDQHSYNNGAGMYRIITLAGYIKANMPLGAAYDAPQLTDEEAWHIAAYINSRPRPEKDVSADWPDISKKPADHPFGPYSDDFPEQQHKFGPFKPIISR